MRPYADRMSELMAGTAQAAGAVRLPLLERPRDGPDGRDRADRRRPRPRRRVQRAGSPPLVRADARGAGGRARRCGSSPSARRRSRRSGSAGSRSRRRWTGFSDKPTYSDAQAVAHAVAEAYVNEEVDRVVLVYNAFVSPLVQRVTVSRAAADPAEALGRRGGREERRPTPRGAPPDFFFEPEPRQILERLLPVYVETQLYRALLESAASFFGAQMTAMRNASKAAGELIDTLTLAMNRARQAEITQEILEVVAGRGRAHAVASAASRPPLRGERFARLR